MKTSVVKRTSAALCLTLASMAATAAEPCKLAAMEIPVTMIGSRAVAKIGINGQQVPMTIDSGAFFSVLTPAAAEQLKLKRRELPFGFQITGLTGTVQDPYMTVVEKLTLSAGELPNVEFVVGGNEVGAGTMGLLGRNFLSMADIEYDLAHGMIRLIFPQGDCKEDQYAYWAGEQPVVDLPLLRDGHDPKRPALRTRARVNDYDLRVLFDTGASSMLSLSAASRAGITREQMTPAGKMGGLGTGSADAWTAPLKRFVLGGEQVSDVRMRIGEFSDGDFDMLLGIDFFLAHRIYVSKSLKRMYFTHNGGPVFALSRMEMPGASAAVEDPSLDAAGYLRRGAASAARKDYAAALADLDRACAMAPEQADCFVQRSRVHLQLRQGSLALKDLNTALAIDPAQPDALLTRASMRGPHGGEAALADLQTLDRTLPSQAHARLAMARMYLTLEKPAEALAQWAQWIPSHKTDAGLPDALNARCWTRMRLGVELDAALEDCNKAVKAEPKDAAYLDSRAWLRLRRGELGDALSDFDQAIKLQPDQAMSLYGRSILRARLGAPTAQADLEAARKLRPAVESDAKRQGLPVPD